MNTEATRNTGVHVVGTGGVGYWLATALARDLSPDFTLEVWDDDVMEGTGALRLPKALEGTSKVESLGTFVYFCMGNAVPTIHDKRLTADMIRDQEGIIGEGDLLIDCTESPTDTREELWAEADNRKARTMRVSYDGDESIVVVSSELPFNMSKGERRALGGNYRMMPSLSLSLVAGGLGAEVVLYMLQKHELASDFPSVFHFKVHVASTLREWGERGL